MKKSSQGRERHRGEAIIGRAFRRSLLVIGVAVAAGILIYLRLQPGEHSRPVAEKTVTVPAPAEKTAARQAPPLHFSNITRDAGIDFVHVNGAYGERLMPETMGSGAAFLDYDNDGDPDLFLVNSRYWPDHPGGHTPTQALYRNDGNGHFTDVTEAAGLAVEAWGMGVAVGDYDGDGRVDLFLSTLGANHLFHNEGGTFREVSAEAGVAGERDRWSSGAAFFDYDGDGDLDLFVLNYVDWSRKMDLGIDFRLAGLGRAYGAPNHFPGTDSYLYRNDGNGRFSEVSASAGIQVHDPESGRPVGKGLGVVPLDYDGDGWIDIAVANDTSRNFLFHNLGNGRFEEVGAFEGLAWDRNGKATGGMGIDAAHYRNDRDLGIVIGNFANEMSSLFVTVDGQPPFADEAVLEGIGPASRLALTFGVLFLDADLDGRPDLLQANGHLEHEINRVQASQHYAQPPQLFWNCGNDCKGQFVLASEVGDLSQPLVGRALACADIDGDGDLDLLISQNGRAPALLRNDRDNGNHWLRLRLHGRGANRDAIGARVQLVAGGVTQYRQVMPARSYLSQIELPLTFGLGPSRQVERLHITWPDGQQQVVEVDRVDTVLDVEQPEAGS